jgi:hypothetical protein
MEKKYLPLSFAIVLAAVIAGLFFYAAQHRTETIRVVGSATRSFDSDLVKWRLTIARTVGMNEITPGYTKINNDLQSLLKRFAASSIPDSAVAVQPVAVMPNYGQGGVVSYNLTQSLYIISPDMKTVESMAINPGDLFSGGVMVQMSQLEYFSEQLSELKRELLAEATRDAYKRASEIAQTADVTIKNIVTARAGVFQIREPYSTEVRDYGIYNSSTRKKDITVTVTAEYAIQ